MHCIRRFLLRGGSKKSFNPIAKNAPGVAMGPKPPTSITVDFVEYSPHPIFGPKLKRLDVVDYNAMHAQAWWLSAKVDERAAFLRTKVSNKTSKSRENNSSLLTLQIARWLRTAWESKWKWHFSSHLLLTHSESPPSVGKNDLFVFFPLQNGHKTSHLSHAGWGVPGQLANGVSFQTSQSCKRAFSGNRRHRDG